VADPDLYARLSAVDARDGRATDAARPARALKAAAGKLATDTVDGRLAFRVKPDGGAIDAGDDRGFDFTDDFTVAVRARLASEQTGVTILGKRGEDTDKGRGGGWAVVHGIQGIGGIGFVATPDVFVPTPARRSASGPTSRSRFTTRTSCSTSTAARSASPSSRASRPPPRARS
jgi:hypothetical protein